MKKFFESLGGFGVVLYYILSLVIAVLPFVMIDVSFWLDLLLIGINMIFPLASIVFWIWGLILAIKAAKLFLFNGDWERKMMNKELNK